MNDLRHAAALIGSDERVVEDHNRLGVAIRVAPPRQITGRYVDRSGDWIGRTGKLNQTSHRQ